MATAVSQPGVAAPRHTVWVRVTHWLTVVAFLALAFSGFMIILTHPRFYWGETGNVNMKPLFRIPVPSSRDTVPTGYNYVLADENGWARSLHFEAAWLFVLTGAVYGIAGFASGHFRRNLVPARGERSLASYGRALRGIETNEDGAVTYNVVQRTAYLSVLFILTPAVIWTGLALSPAFNAAFPFFVDVLGGRQSARTLHFFVSDLLVVFLVVHVLMIALAGFWTRTRAMITGRAKNAEDNA
ncbi:MAG TPA: cytochrome b/b6 domain-containing protein [Acidobacteriaceae bacterium]|nr:cytochrome b/b6 domain-containing protein [Acidobacteriaceae bacterium]